MVPSIYSFIQITSVYLRVTQYSTRFLRFLKVTIVFNPYIKIYGLKYGGELYWLKKIVSSMNWNVNNGLCNNVAEKLYMERSKVRLKTKKKIVLIVINIHFSNRVLLLILQKLWQISIILFYSRGTELELSFIPNFLIFQLLSNEPLRMEWSTVFWYPVISSHRHNS